MVWCFVVAVNLAVTYMKAVPGGADVTVDAQVVSCMPVSGCSAVPTATAIMHIRLMAWLAFVMQVRTGKTLATIQVWRVS